MSIGDGSIIGAILAQTNVGPVAKVAALTNAEYWALKESEFRAVFDGAVAVGSSQWFLLTVPSDRGVQVISRELSSNLAGVDYQIYTGVSGYSVQSPTKLSYYNTYRGGPSPVSTFHAISTPTTTGTWIDTPALSGAGTTAGNSGRPAGTNGSNSGFDYIPPGSLAFGVVTNLATADNRITLRLTLAEIVV